MATAMPRSIKGSRPGYCSASFLNSSLYVLGLDLDLVLASGGSAKRSPERHFDHQPARSASIAARMRGGDIGICVMRTPAAFDTALAIAASGGTIDVSPTPRTP